jgi:hypothetical protein
VNVLRAPPALSLYLSLLLLGLATYFGGAYGLSAVRLLYLFGCVGVAFQALRFGAAYHFEALVVLFAFSPYLRRIVDYGCGFEVHGYMLTGPLLAALLPTTALPAAVMATRGHLVGRLAPYLFATSCLGYSALLTELNGQYVSAAIYLSKSVSVLLYGCWLLAKAEDPQQVIRQGARAFAVVTPIVGIYGIMQYFNPSPADSYWMTASAMSSIGVPEPEQVRVFSTMNSPASFANFLVFGLMLVGFVASPWKLLICFGPGSVALLLSQSRTAWLALAASIIFTLFYSATKLRSLILAIAIAVATTFAIIATPLGDAISNRLETISDGPSQDSSAQARLDQLASIFGHLDNYLIGYGTGTGGQTGTGSEYNTQGNALSDGLIAFSINSMGIFFGLMFNISVIWAGVQALLRVGHRTPPDFVIAAALIAGQLITIPLVNPTSAEFGVFFWAVVAVALRTPPAFRNLRRGSAPVFSPVE